VTCHSFCQRMYSSRRFHSKGTDSYLSIGDPYDKPHGVETRFKSRQFQTCPPKEGQLDGYFEKFKYYSDVYQDTNLYRLTQPRQGRRLGFGSFDAARRDEFTLDLRAQQYKDLLEKEKTFHKKYLKDRMDRDSQLKSASAPGDTLPSIDEKGALAAAGASFFQTQVPVSLYDIGKEGVGTTPICNKCPRETFYCRHRVGNGSQTLRRVAHHKTSNDQYGQRDAVNKPMFGRKSHIKDFYDANHLSTSFYG